MGRTVALVGALHPGARQLALALEDDPAVERVLGLSRHEPPLLGPKFEFVQAGPGDARFGKAPPLSLATTMDLAVRDGMVSIETARLHGPRTDLVYRGQVRLAPSMMAFPRRNSSGMGKVAM